MFDAQHTHRVGVEIGLHREDVPAHRRNEINRRDVGQRAAMTAAAFAVTPPSSLLTGSSKDDVLAQIPRQHDERV